MNEKLCKIGSFVFTQGVLVQHIRRRFHVQKIFIYFIYFYLFVEILLNSVRIHLYDNRQIIFPCT